MKLPSEIIQEISESDDVVHEVGNPTTAMIGAILFYLDRQALLASKEPKGEITKEFPEGKENYCPHCYFGRGMVVLREYCPNENKPKECECGCHTSPHSDNEMIKNGCDVCFEFYHNKPKSEFDCPTCGKKMTEVWDKVAKKYTGHLWRCKNCMKDDIIISIG